MNVPRGTPVTAPGAWRVIPLFLPRAWRAALARDLKTELRVPITAKNSRVHPGTFAGLDLDSGRARRTEVPELRARCRFESGNVRAVTVTPTLGRGDLLWIRTPRGARARSRLTLQLIGVGVARLQDMGDVAALNEGVTVLPHDRRKHLSPRDQFAEAWEETYGAHSWRANPWVWIYRFNVHEEQVDRLLEQWRK